MKQCELVAAVRKGQNSIFRKGQKIWLFRKGPNLSLVGFKLQSN